jgi:hypothetical protein
LFSFVEQVPKILPPISESPCIMYIHFFDFPLILDRRFTNVYIMSNRMRYHKFWFGKILEGVGRCVFKIVFSAFALMEEKTQKDISSYNHNQPRDSILAHHAQNSRLLPLHRLPVIIYLWCGYKHWQRLGATSGKLCLNTLTAVANKLRNSEQRWSPLPSDRCRNDVDTNCITVSISALMMSILVTGYCCWVVSNEASFSDLLFFPIWILILVIHPSVLSGSTRDI